MFFRKKPFQGGYTVFAGLDPLLRSLEALRFTREDMGYLESLKIFSQEFLSIPGRLLLPGRPFRPREGSLDLSQRAAGAGSGNPHGGPVRRKHAPEFHQLPVPRCHQGLPDRPGIAGERPSWSSASGGPRASTAPSRRPGRPLSAAPPPPPIPWRERPTASR